MTCKHGNHSMHCGWCEDQARITELEAHAQGLREQIKTAEDNWAGAADICSRLHKRIAELEAQLASAQEMNRILVPRVSVANSRPLAEPRALYPGSVALRHAVETMKRVLLQGGSNTKLPADSWIERALLEAMDSTEWRRKGWVMPVGVDVLNCCGMPVADGHDPECPQASTVTPFSVLGNIKSEDDLEAYVQARMAEEASPTNTRPLAEIVAEFENSSPENKARMLAAREARAAQVRPGDTDRGEYPSDAVIAWCMLAVDDPLLWGRLGEGQGDMLRKFARALVANLKGNQ